MVEYERHASWRPSAMALPGSLAPLGWGNWQSAVASVTGLIAKENVVGTFGVLFGALAK